MAVNEVIQYNGKNWTVLEIEESVIHLIDNEGYGICVPINELS